MLKKKIAPSILSADFTKLGTEIKFIEASGAEIIHVDVMDGVFVPNITIGSLIVKAIRPLTNLEIDVHLMIANPDLYLEDFAKAGADYLTVHTEAVNHLHRSIQKIKDLGVKASVALNPHTSLHNLDEILPYVDMILLMSVNPGFGGQSFIPSVLDKIKRLRKMLDERGLNHVEIEIDGGIKLENIKEISDAGANIFVSGSGIFKHENRENIVSLMKSKL